MKTLLTMVRLFALAAVAGGLTASGGMAQSAAGTVAPEVRLVELQGGSVEIIRAGATNGVPSSDTNLVFLPFDRLRSGPHTRGRLVLFDKSIVSFDELTEIEILPPSESGLFLWHGLLSFFHRDKPGRIRVLTSGTTAGIEGTEFLLEAAGPADAQTTTLSVIDGQVLFTNDHGALTLTNGDQAVAEAGRAPKPTAGFVAQNLLQWCFYYPAVLDLRNLPLSPDEEKSLADSLAAYRSGDVPAALEKYPENRQTASDAERVYFAAVLLAAGQVQPAEASFSALSSTNSDERLPRLAAALRSLISAVNRAPQSSILNLGLSTELLAASYFEQSRADRGTSLATALDLARRATTNSPLFSFAWERVAELEFSFGRTDRAAEALTHSLALAPRNAQALALKGFLLAAQNRTREAMDSFNCALAVDSALGNAWLGRGLCRIRRGDRPGGREDLLIAAALEPRRAGLRSYLGKVWGDAGDTPRALHELYLAKSLDTNDPTAWLYSALLNEQNNRINDGIRDLEKSQALNDNRAVYRSGLLLDQDRAVRSANLARVYQEAGMDLVAVREAAHAVSADYANYSAHLFLANSYNALRDPNEINLRYETPTYVEYLVGNLLAPVSAGVLSPAITQQEYSRLFERDHFGVVSETEYLSRGAWTESGAQYGTFGNLSYDLEGFYRSDPGQRANNDTEQRQLAFTFKQQLTPQDSLYGYILQFKSDGGDLLQYYNPSNAIPGLRTRENQEPLLVLGYHHEWAPGSHTLLLVSRLRDDYLVNNPQAAPLVLGESSGVLMGVDPSFQAGQSYHSELVIYTGEAQQILQRGTHTVIAGAKYQHGSFSTQNQFAVPADNFYFPDQPPGLENFNQSFERISAYGYDLWKPLDALQLIGGLSFDWLSFPRNFQFAPLSAGQQKETQWSPKAGFIWTPRAGATFRGAYTRSLSGASLEQSVQIEPSQVAGFNQLFRSIIPESVAGANAGAHFETYDLALEQKLGWGTYLGVSGELLYSTVDRGDGVFISDPFMQDNAFAAITPERLGFRERTLQFTLDQLLGNEFAVSAAYRLTDAELRDNFAAIPNLGPNLHGFAPQLQERALLHQLDLHATFNHPGGFFGQLQAIWMAQQNSGYHPSEPGDDFWQFNVFAGYRFPKRHVEATLGLLNLSGRDYRLNPLNLHNELPRARTLVARVKVNF